MPTTRFLRPLRTNVFQVLIEDTVTAVLRVVDATIMEIWTLADEPRLLVTLTDATGLTIDPIPVAQRLAEGEFDNDFRFEIHENPEPDDPASLYFVRQIATPSQKVIQAFTTDDPYGNVEAAREAQAIPFEERMSMYAERGW